MNEVYKRQQLTVSEAVRVVALIDEVNAVEFEIVCFINMKMETLNTEQRRLLDAALIQRIVREAKP